MSTPTTYPLEYDDDFCQSGPCGTGPCLGIKFYNTRPQDFCEDVVLRKDCTIIGDLTVTPARISVGGYTFTPLVIGTISGPHLVLAVY
jgi:hypothetical protein